MRAMPRECGSTMSRDDHRTAIAPRNIIAVIHRMTIASTFL
jgi:hypothetical protein